MSVTVSPVHCYDALGFDAPECRDCEGTGVATYLRGPYLEQRECEDCLGAGRRLTCPDCTDGTTRPASKPARPATDTPPSTDHK